MGRPGRPTRHEAAAAGGDLSALLPVPVPNGVAFSRVWVGGSGSGGVG
jgi:hypothetical protein